MNRLLWVDVVKGILILFVILGHSIQFVIGENCFDNRVWNVIYSFHMPCFIAISGFFAPNSINGIEQFWSFIVKRFSQLMIPMLLWQAIYNFLPPVANNISLISFLDCGSFWFLWALFFISLIYAFVAYISTRLHFPAAILHVLVIICLIGLMVFYNYREHGVQYIAYYYPYFVMGFYLNRKLNTKQIDSKWFWMAFVLWLIGAMFWRMHGVPVILQGISFVPSSILSYTYRYIVGGIAVFTICGLSSTYLRESSSWTSIFSRFGILSLGVYTVHISLLKVLNILKPYMETSQSISSALYVIALFILLTILSIVIVSLLSRYTISSRLLLGKLKK